LGWGLTTKTKTNMDHDFWNNVSDFGTINLTELNATASFLKRINKKYLITETQLATVLKDLKWEFNVLEIAGKRIFSYDNVYMDTSDYLFYNQHENKENARTKIRTRLYADSDLTFFEIKQKEDGVQKKFRYQFPLEEHGTMTKEAPTISPSIKTTYNRLTLVSKTGEERLTIDFNIRTLDLRDEKKSKIM